MGFSLKSVGGALVGGALGGVGGAILGSGFGGGGGIGGSSNPYANLPQYKDPVTDPAIIAMSSRLSERSARQAQKHTNEALPDKPVGLTGNLPEFDAIRDRVAKQYEQELGKLNQNVSRQQQEGGDALKRRFAAMGALNSGASIKQQQLFGDRLREESGEQTRQLRDQAMQSQQDVDVAQAQERQRRNEFELGRFDQQRESAMGRNMAREAANIDAEFKDRVFQFEAESKIGQLDLAYKAAQMESQAQRFNSALSAAQAGDKKGILGSIFGGSGPLGLF